MDGVRVVHPETGARGVVLSTNLDQCHGGTELARVKWNTMKDARKVCPFDYLGVTHVELCELVRE